MDEEEPRSRTTGLRWVIAIWRVLEVKPNIKGIYAGED
jgi:hypothetical protein